MPSHFQLQPPQLKASPSSDAPLFPLGLLSSAAGVRRALALVEPVKNVHHPKRSTDPAPGPPCGGQASAEVKWRVLHTLYLVSATFPPPIPQGRV